MNQQVAAVFSSPKLLIEQIGSRYALSNQALLLVAAPLAMAGLLFEPGRVDQPPFLHLVFTAAGYLAVVFTLLIARRFLPDEPRPSKPLAVWLAFLVAGLVRGITLLLLSYFTTGITQADFVYRLLGAPSFTVLMMSLAAIVAANYRTYKEAIERLSAERYQLQISTAGERGKIDLQREELLQKIKTILAPAFQSISQTLGDADKTTRAAVQSLTSTVEEVVRPLTRELSSSRDEMNPEPPMGALQEKVPLPKKIKLGQYLLAPLAATFIAINVIPVAVFVDRSLNSAIIVGLAFSSIWLIVGAISKLTRKVEISPAIGWILIPSTYALSLSPFLWIVPAIGSRFTGAQVVLFMLTGAALSGALYYAQLVQLRRGLTLERFREVNLELEQVNAAIKQELWLNRRRLASILHGPIQASLYAAAMKLSQTNKPTKALISEVESDIQQALEKLTELSLENNESVTESLEKIRELWIETTQIEIQLDPELIKKLEINPATAEAVVEVSREFINNAIKHASPKKIDLTVRSLGSRVLVQVVNDGAIAEEDSRPGFGSKLLSELTLSWNRKREGDTTVCYAEIVMGHDNL